MWGGKVQCQVIQSSYAVFMFGLQFCIFQDGATKSLHGGFLIDKNHEMWGEHVFKIVTIHQDGIRSWDLICLNPQIIGSKESTVGCFNGMVEMFLRTQLERFRSTGSGHLLLITLLRSQPFVEKLTEKVQMSH